MNILITGGASGLGEAITRKTSKDSNCNVYFTYNKSEENAERISSDFPNAHAIKCNFSDENDMLALLKRVAEMDLDVLINNAYSGTPTKSHFPKISPDVFLNEFKENIIPTLRITQSAITEFKKKKSGKIITILTSALLNTPPLGFSVYVANKAYLHELTKVWATENAKYNITSNAVSPSFMQTSLNKDIDSRIVEQIRENHPLKKLLTPEEVAETVCFLCYASQQINGLNLILNSAENIH